MGRMLFWGQQGVSPDIQTAVKHYERGATKLHDPVSMYDYAIVLLTVRILNVFAPICCPESLILMFHCVMVHKEYLIWPAEGSLVKCLKLMLLTREVRGDQMY